MIRIVYWILVLIEIILLLAVLLLFIVTDSRTIKLIAETTLDSSEISYRSIEGNLFNGLKVRELTYKQKPLFRTATIHWNPLTLFYNKISITKVDVQGVEIKNIIKMVQDLGSSSNKTFELAFSTSLDSMHLDINPYVFEGVKFSSLALNMKKFELKKNLTFESNTLELKFDSDIVNVKLNGAIDKSRLLLDKVSLKNISPKAITLFVQRVLKKYPNSKGSQKKSSSKPFVMFKEIKAKHILGTLKSTKYGALTLKGATLVLKNAVVDPYHSYQYRVKDLDFKGQTNFGFMKFKGFVKASTIHAKGEVVLDKELFKKYSLPFNFKGLKHLPSKLTLNHSGVWLEIDHKVKKLLDIKNNAFNVNVKRGRHKVSYIYAKDLIVESDLNASISYADEVDLKAKTVINFNKGTTNYTGNAKLYKIKNLPPMVSDYLLKELKGKFSGDTKGLSVDFESKYLKGKLKTPEYKRATINIKSLEKNILLSKLFPEIDTKYANETLSLENSTFLDFKNSKKSNTQLKLTSTLLNVNAKGNLFLPAKIDFSMDVPPGSKLRSINHKIKFDKIKDIKGEVAIAKNIYKVKMYDSQANVSASFAYNALKKSIDNGRIQMDNNLITFFLDTKSARVHTNITNIGRFMNNIKRYYFFDISNIQGDMSFDLIREKDFNKITISSSNIKYLSDGGSELKVFNIGDIALKFSIDDRLNIQLDRYKFAIDNNSYLDHFYATKPSFFSFANGEFIIKKAWINDQLLLNGNYNINTLHGTLKLETKSYAFKNKDFSLQFDSNLLVNLNKRKINIEGDITLVEGIINYEIEGSGLVEDSDIVVMQEMIEEEESPLKNLKLYIKVHNKKPLHYYGNGVNIEFYNELSIVKNYNQEMFVTGMSTITKGYYELEDKKFSLDESHLYFAGDITKPLLDIKANYEKEQYNVHIFISGTTDEPIVNFNSDPYLTQQEILSLILFDGTGSSNGRGAEAYTLLGGTFAKGLMKSLGINVDHLLLGSDENDELSLEIGRKISDNISILYLHKNGLDGAKVRVEHSNSFETDIIIQPPNTSSIEFLYKQDR